MADTPQWQILLLRSYLKFSLRFMRWRFLGHPVARDALLQKGALDQSGAILAFWHHGLMLMPALWYWAQDKNQALNVRVMISRNRDGRLISKAVAPWGIIGVEGSSAKLGRDKGGAKAFRVALRILRSGGLFAITPDGPKGPARKVKEGTPRLADFSGAPVIPIGVQCSQLRLPTWDKMKLPLPFGRGVFVLGEPLKGSLSADDIQHAIDDVECAAARLYERTQKSLFFRLWLIIGILLKPYLHRLIKRRILAGKEDIARVHERQGFASIERPTGKIVWFHAASVGETQSVMPLVEHLANDRPDLSFLITTATRTGAARVSELRKPLDPALSMRILHQYIPYDVAQWVRRFLGHWKPDALCIVDSELWPGLISLCSERAIPMGLLNARLSQRSFLRWRRFPRTIAKILSHFAFVAARDESDAAKFHALGSRNTVCFGDLKRAAPPLAYDSSTLEFLQQRFCGRPIFVAASTHIGEEELIASAIKSLTTQHPHLLTVIIPRHPERGSEIARLLGGNPPQRSLGRYPDEDDKFWIVDTLGELGLFYRLATLAFVGNSLIRPGGGHNPFEPAHAGVPFACGPFIQNFTSAYGFFDGIAPILSDSSNLREWIDTLLKDPVQRMRFRSALMARLTQEKVIIPALTRQIASLLNS